MKFCWKCGKENDDSASVCTYCGYNVLESAMTKSQIKKTNVFENYAYNSIGGWLIIVAITRIFAPLFMLSSIIGYLTILTPTEGELAFAQIFQINYWSVPKSTLIFNLISSIIIFIFDIYLAYLLIEKKRVFPRAMIIFLVLTAIYCIIDYSIHALFGLKRITPVSRMNTNIFTSIFSCIIWIPYFLFSKRVKGTFVN